MTRQDAINWCAAQLGKAMDFDGAYGAQCVDFFNFYYKYLTGRNPYSDGYGVNGARDLWNVPTPRFTKITNNPNDLNQLPSPGDIMIYNGNMPGSGGYGHVAVVGEEKSTYYEQNYGGMYVKKNSRKFNGYEIGWLSYNGFQTPSTLQPFQRVVGSAGVNYREHPTTSATVIQDFQPGEVLDFKGFVRGENVSGNDIWFQGRYTGGFSWSGSFTDISTSGLPDLTPQPPVVEPPQPPDTSKYVIDVSAHNTITDYSTVISNVRGAIAKAGHTGKSYGGTALNGDPKFADYKANFGDKLAGAYWYGYASLNPVIEAKHFVEAVGQVPDNFTYWLDIEEADDQTDTQINNWCVAFLTEVDNLTHRVCGIYMNRNWYDNFITAETKGNRPIWLAHYDTGEFSNPVTNQVAHQFTSSGKVAGYDGNLDLNHVKEEFFKPTAITPPEPPKPEEPPVTPPEPEKPVEPPVEGSQTLLDVVLGWLKSLANWLSQWVRK